MVSLRETQRRKPTSALNSLLLPLCAAAATERIARPDGDLDLLSERLPGLPADRLDCSKRSMPNTRLAARLLDLFETLPARTWHLTDAGRHVVGLFNCDAGKPADVRTGTCGGPSVSIRSRRPMLHPRQQPGDRVQATLRGAGNCPGPGLSCYATISTRAR